MGNEIVTKSDMRIIAARSQTQDAFEAVGIIRDSHHPALAGVCFLDKGDLYRPLWQDRESQPRLLLSQACSYGYLPFDMWLCLVVLQ